MADITVIIISWNARDYLRECLSSIRDTAAAEVCEVIVVDNASADGSADMVAAEFPDAILIRSNRNLGFSAANNLAIGRAKGRYLAFVNSDVVIHPQCLQTLRSYLSTHADTAMVGPRIVGRDGQLQGSCRRLPSFWNTMCRALAVDRAFSFSKLLSGHEMRHFAHDVQAEAEVLSGCLWLARSDAIQAVGMLDERFFFYMEDVDWCRRFRRAGWRLVFLPDASATHYGGGSTANAPLQYSIQYHRASLSYWRKYHGLPGAFGYRAIALAHHGLRLVARGLLFVLRAGASPEGQHKLREDAVCLRWLLSGRGV